MSILPHPRRRQLRPVWALTLALAAAAASAQSADPATAPGTAEIPLDFRKIEKSARVPESVSKPVIDLPYGLAPDEKSRPGREEPPLPPAPEGEDGQLESLPKESRHGGGGSRPRPSYDLYEEASKASQWAAEWQVHHDGLPEVYRTGAWQGLRDAFERALERRRAFDEGEDDGASDPRAASSGGREGEKAAIARGQEAARRAVEAEFRDLSREPRRFVKPARQPLPDHLVRVREPSPEEVFGQFPIGGYLSYENFDDYVDPWRLYQMSTWGVVYDDDWAHDRRAFEHWRDRGDDAIWDRLSRPEQDYFRRTFAGQLDYWRSREMRRHAGRAYREGYDDGWEYGATVGAEFRYRQGYREGFLAAATEAATAAWDEIYPAVYERTYREEHEHWSGSAMPEIETVEIFDRNDDGIYEPGEELRLGIGLANFGGREIKLELGADGAAVEPAVAARPVSLARRSRSRAELLVRVDPGQAPRTESSFSVRAGSAGKTVPLRVSRPLEIDGQPRLEAVSSVAGRVRVEVTVVNRSRKPVGGTLDVFLGERRIPGNSLEVLPGGSSRVLSLEVADVPPLDLLEGRAELRFELRSRDVVQDQLRQRLPALGLDLESGELVDFWLEAVYGDVELGRADAARLVELVARRLAADWEVQRHASGNPYKEDLQGSRRTALGELVAATRAERRPARHADLERALVGRLKSLVEQLPGTHPFLRGSFKKLAGKLG